MDRCRAELTKVVVGGVIQEDESKTDGPTSNGGSKPVDRRVRCPGKDEKSNRNEPARIHHGDQALLSRRLASILLGDLEIVLVHERSTGGAHEHSDSQRNEHHTSARGAPSFANLVNNRVSE